MDAGREMGVVPASHHYYASLAYYDRDGPGMRRLLEGAEDPWVDDQFQFAPKALGFAQAFALEGEDVRARAYYDSARVVLEARIAAEPEDPRLHSALGIVFAGLGRAADALREGETGLRLMPPEREAWRGTWRVYELAQIYAALGRDGDAVELLESLLARPSGFTVARLRLDPAWDPLRTHPRFVALVGR
jgi:predicted Zn-dependent protease